MYCHKAQNSFFSELMSTGKEHGLIYTFSPLWRSSLMEHCENEVYSEYRCQWFHYSIAITFFNQKLGLFIIIHKSKQTI